MKTITEKLQDFAKLVEVETVERLHKDGLACEANIDKAKTKVKEGQKYAKVDIGNSGRFMVEMSTGNIFGIKGYGQIHRGHWYGNLDTTDQYNWGGYYPVKKENPTPLTKAHGYPILTFAPPTEVQEDEVMAWMKENPTPPTFAPSSMVDDSKRA